MLSPSSSDEEIAWGPPTLKEIKNYFRRPSNRKLCRRQTAVGTINAITEQMQQKCNISSSYFTPNESEKLELESHNVKSDLSNYMTASEGSKISSETCWSDTLIDFVQNAKTRPTQVDIKSTSLIDDDSLLADITAGSVTLEDESFLLNSKSSDEYFHYKEEVITISDSDDDCYEVKTSAQECVIKPENISLDHSNYNKSENFETCLSGESKTSEDDKQVGEQNNNYQVPNNSLISDVNLDIVHNTDLQTSMEVPQLRPQQTPVPKISIFSFRVSEESHSPLDDSLEKIERLLKLAEQKCNESTDSIDNASNEDVQKICSEEVNLPEVQNSEQTKTLPSADNLSKEQTPTVDSSQQRKSFIPRKMQSPTIGKCTKKMPATISKMPAVQHFRVPRTPSNKSVISKSIISPVAMYIKYSPKAVLTTTSTSAPLKNTKLSPCIPKTVKGKENVLSFPEVIYKPSKKQLCTKEKEIRLPRSIQKMVPKRHLVKHEQRILTAPDENVQLKLINDSELTRNSISDSLLSDSNVDVSIWTSKQPYKTD